MPRTRVTDIRPVVTETVIGTTRQMRHLAENPNTRAIHDIERVGPDRVLMKISRVDLPVKARRARPRLVYAGPRLTRRGAILIASAVGLPAALFATGWITWLAWGDQITAGLQAAGALLAILALTMIAWVASLTTGVCPGLHCPGCGHK